MRAFAVAALAVAGLTHYYAAADGPRSIWSVGLGRNGSFGNSAHNYEDDNVHLGSTMLLTTALVAAVLTAISNQLVAAEIPKVGILYLGPKGTALSVDDIDAALKEWEADQLALGRHLDRSGRALGNRSQFP
jgi:hypothetical protein